MNTWTREHVTLMVDMWTHRPETCRRRSILNLISLDRMWSECRFSVRHCSTDVVFRVAAAGLLISGRLNVSVCVECNEHVMLTGMCELWQNSRELVQDKLRDSSAEQIWTWNVHKCENFASLLLAPEPDVTLQTTNQLLWFHFISQYDKNSQRGLRPRWESSTLRMLGWNSSQTSENETGWLSEEKTPEEEEEEEEEEG